VYQYYSYGTLYCFHIQGRFGRIPLLQLADGKCWKYRVGVPRVGTRRKFENCVLICTGDDRIERYLGLIGENLSEYELWTGEHKSQGCGRKDISILFKTINLFDFSWTACRKGYWQ